MIAKILFLGIKQKVRENKKIEGSVLISCLGILFATSIAFIACGSFLSAKLSYLQRKSEALYSSFLIAGSEDFDANK